jgi:3-oxoacyl-[acyl-carrier protein] reductase
MVRQGIERFGRIDVVVAAAAVRPHAPFLEMTIEEWQRVLNVNLNGAFYLCKAVAPGMIERGSGSIVLFGGWNAMNGSHGAPANGAAKMGLLGLVRSMSTALAPHGVRTNMVVPGQIDTKRDGPSSFQNGQADDVPLRRRGLPEEIAKTCLFLASDDASYITGEHIGVTGGRLVP